MPTAIAERPAQVPRWANINQTAAHLGVSRDTVRRLISAKKIHAGKIGNTIRIDLNKVDQALEEAAA
ncbi:helix-turn-helix domain-containing protein [Microbacterium sp. T32]|uniref:helix-turn-helix domain-containing protein n=1 Tax=Microbacterium sp. T32 TaxID=1776083 RepID=UPI0007AB9313|nr:helix-turn-helix domain-containing protein [Microbacterium sp. T32]KZE41443.1 hypothetical protein AVW09_02305 [Microbacterium sp. T32]